MEKNNITSKELSTVSTGLFVVSVLVTVALSVVNKVKGDMAVNERLDQISEQFGHIKQVK